MRYLRYLVFGSIAVGLVIVALANRGEVSLTLDASGIGGFDRFQPSIPSTAFYCNFSRRNGGLLIGFVWEWLREMKHRTAAKTEHRQVVRLEREVPN